MRFSGEFIDEIKYRNDIYDVISSYVTLKRAGSNYNGLCPFHSEKTPSFTVFPSTSNYYCFGCGAGGDVITFVMKTENLDYPSAVQELARRAGIPMPVESEQEKTLHDKRARLYQMNRDAARFFNDSLRQPYGAAGLTYLKKRGISDHGIRHFGLGFAPNAFYLLTDYMKKKGYTEDELIEGFLCGRSKKNGKLYDYFRNRVIFPIIDTAGNVIAFGGRVMDDSVPKYLNTSDTPAFKKSRNLYALNMARKHCEEYLIMCEGYMDVIAMHLAGFENAVATLGTAVTQEHARMISKYTKKVILAYDSDGAGQNAANKAIRLLESVGVEIRVLQMNGAKDPDEYIKTYGREKFALLLNESIGQQDFLMQKALAPFDLNITDDRIKAAAAVAELLASIPSSVEREIYLKKAVEALQVSAEALEHDVKRLLAKRKRQEKNNTFRATVQQTENLGDRVNPDAVKNRRAAKAEEQILGILMLFPEFIPKCADSFENSVYHLKFDEFFSAFHRKLYEMMIEDAQAGTTFDLSHLGQSLDTDEMSRATQLQMKRQGMRNDEDVLRETIETLRDANEAYARGQKESVGVDDLTALIHKKRNQNEQT